MGWTPTVNIYDPNINYGDVYLLNYFGKLVFFSVCDIGAETVKLVELETYPYQEGFMLYDDLRLAKHPYFVKKNVRTKSDYEVLVCEEGLPILVEWDSPITKEIEIPMTGVYFAEKVNNYRNVYFVNEENIIFC